MINAQINLERARTALSSMRRMSTTNPSIVPGTHLRFARPHANAVTEAQWASQVAEAQYQDVQRSAQQIVYDTELAQMDLDLAKMRLAEIQVGLDVTRTVLSVGRLRDQLNDARIVAPFDGVILESNVIEGRQVQGYAPLMRLADPSALEISADLQETEMSELTEGMPVTAEFVNRPGKKSLVSSGASPILTAAVRVQRALRRPMTKISRFASRWKVWISPLMSTLSATACV